MHDGSFFYKGLFSRSLLDFLAQGLNQQTCFINKILPIYSASLIQRTFLGYVKMYFVANCTLYQGFTILALEMLP